MVSSELRLRRSDHSRPKFFIIMYKTYRHLYLHTLTELHLVSAVTSNQINDSAVDMVLDPSCLRKSLSIGL